MDEHWGTKYLAQEEKEQFSGSMIPISLLFPQLKIIRFIDGFIDCIFKYI